MRSELAEQCHKLLRAELFWGFTSQQTARLKGSGPISRG